jgi:Xaa-Pro aminopeptidase
MTVPATAFLAARVRRVREAVASSGCDALVVSNLRNIRYLSNFDGSSASLLMTASRLYLLSDFRYSAAVLSLLGSPGAPPDAEFLCVEGSYDEALAQLLVRACPGGRVGIESAHMTVKQHSWLSERLSGSTSAPPVLVPTDGLVERGRVVKDAWELETLRAAGRLLSQAARGILTQTVRPGRTEREIALEVDRRLMDAGFERTAFATIVAAGPTSAMPHARPGARVVN